MIIVVNDENASTPIDNLHFNLTIVGAISIELGFNDSAAG